METKKSQKADLESRKPLFLEIGLCASLLLTIGAFAWGSDKKVRDTGPEVMEEYIQQEQIENTVQDMKVPQMATPKQTLLLVTDRIQLVNNDTKIEADQVFADFDEATVFTGNPTSDVEIAGEVWPEFWENPEHMPKFQGGDLEKFRGWIYSRLRYPQTALEMGIEGTVQIEFMVDPTGTVVDVKVTSNTDRMLNNEAMRVVRSSPKWEPGRQGNRAVKVRYTMGITFKRG